MIYFLSELTKLEKQFHKYLCLYSTLILLMIAFLAYSNQYNSKQLLVIEGLKKNISQKKSINNYVFDLIRKSHDCAELIQLNDSKTDPSIKQRIQEMISYSRDIKMLKMTSNASKLSKNHSPRYKIEEIKLMLEIKTPITLAAFLRELESNSRDTIYLNKLSMRYLKNSYNLKTTLSVVKYQKEAT